MDSEFWSKEFPITTLNRENLLEAGLPAEAVYAITDEHMTAIAAKMEDYYLNNGFWEDLHRAVLHVIGDTSELFAERHTDVQTGEDVE